MKLLVVTAFSDFDDEMLKMLKDAEISIFSKTSVSGFKELAPKQMTENWFAATRDEYDATMIFAFTEAEKAQKVLGMAKAYNEEHATSKSKIRAFIMNVEASA